MGLTSEMSEGVCVCESVFIGDAVHHIQIINVTHLLTSKGWLFVMCQLSHPFPKSQTKKSEDPLKSF